MLFEWDESMNVGYDQINEQHKKLISLINELHSAMLEGKSKDVMSGILGELKDYTVYHFKTEEDLFDKFDYSETNDHKTEHQAFVLKVGDFISEFESGKVGVSLELMNFLKNWLIQHIKGSDMKYKGKLE